MNLPQITFRQEFILDGVQFSVHQKFKHYTPNHDRNFQPYFRKRRSIPDRIIEQLRQQKSTPHTIGKSKFQISNSMPHYDTEQDCTLPQINLEINNTTLDLKNNKVNKNFIKINKFQTRIKKKTISLISKEQFQSFISSVRSQIQY